MINLWIVYHRCNYGIQSLKLSTRDVDIDDLFQQDNGLEVL